MKIDLVAVVFLFISASVAAAQPFFGPPVIDTEEIRRESFGPPPPVIRPNEILRENSRESFGPTLISPASDEFSIAVPANHHPLLPPADIGSAVVSIAAQSPRSPPEDNGHRPLLPPNHPLPVLQQPGPEHAVVSIAEPESLRRPLLLPPEESAVTAEPENLHPLLPSADIGSAVVSIAVQSPRSPPEDNGHRPPPNHPLPVLQQPGPEHAVVSIAEPESLRRPLLLPSEESAVTAEPENLHPLLPSADIGSAVVSIAAQSPRSPPEDNGHRPLLPPNPVLQQPGPEHPPNEVLQQPGPEHLPNDDDDDIFQQLPDDILHDILIRRATSLESILRLRDVSRRIRLIVEDFLRLTFTNFPRIRSLSRNLYRQMLLSRSRDVGQLRKQMKENTKFPFNLEPLIDELKMLTQVTDEMQLTRNVLVQLYRRTIFHCNDY